MRGNAMQGITTFVGLGIREQTIGVALAYVGKPGKLGEHKDIPNTPGALKALAAKLTRSGLDLRFCYEAGPNGFSVYQHLFDIGYDCVVVAPVPNTGIRTTRRSPAELAVLHRAGALTAVAVPDQVQDAMLYLTRARLATVRNLRRATQPLSCFLSPG
jgi:transposase